MKIPHANPEELAFIEEQWSKLSEEQVAAAKKIVPLLRTGDVFTYEYGDPDSTSAARMYVVQRGTVVPVTGSAENMNSAASYDGHGFESFQDEPALMVAGLRRCLAFPTGHVAPYDNRTLQVHQSTGYVDLDDPMTEITGTILDTSVFTLTDDPRL